MTTISKCYRCKRSGIDRSDWNIEHIAGYEAGAVCPTCQSPDENAEAFMNDAIGNPQLQNATVLRPRESGDSFYDYVNALVNTYPTPEIMRARALRLAVARPDLLGGPVKLMHLVADGMESGELFEES